MSKLEAPPTSPGELTREYTPCSLYIAHIDYTEILPFTSPPSMAYRASLPLVAEMLEFTVD